jgi:hypothetical protein
VPYHLELRQFPHSAWRFNLDEREMCALAEDWARERIVEFGERKWSPERATLTILEGPQLAVQDLAMGRGWRTAQRRSVDVTERVLAESGTRVAQALRRTPDSAQVPAEAAGTGDAAAATPTTDPLALGVQIAALLGPDAIELLAAWRAAAAASRELTPSESLALAEQAVRRG